MNVKQLELQIISENTGKSHTLIVYPVHTQLTLKFGNIADEAKVTMCTNLYLPNLEMVTVCSAIVC